MKIFIYSIFLLLIACQSKKDKLVDRQVQLNDSINLTKTEIFKYSSAATDIELGIREQLLEAEKNNTFLQLYDDPKYTALKDSIRDMGWEIMRLEGKISRWKKQIDSLDVELKRY